jgi:hypothetical protein
MHSAGGAQVAEYGIVVLCYENNSQYISAECFLYLQSERHVPPRSMMMRIESSQTPDPYQP